MLFASERPGGGYGPHSYLKRARHHNVDGCALIGLDPDDDEVRRLVRGEIPCVAIDMELEGPRTEVVMSDNEAGAATAVRHLYDLGHRRIATITGMIDSRPGIDRLRGYRAAIQELGLAYRDDYVRYGDFYAESGREATARLLAPRRAADRDLRRRRPDGHRRHPRGLRGGPERARTTSAIVGFDDIQLAPHVNPPLTTLRQDKLGLGAAAGDALVARDRRRSGAPRAPDAPRRARRTRQSTAAR